MKTTPRSTLNDMELDFKQTQIRLDRLERHEWLRWGLAFVVMLALTIGLFVLAVPAASGGDASEQMEMTIALRGLLALVLLFDVFVVRQQVLLTRLRRDLATHSRVITALETLKKPADYDDVERPERRRSRRVGLDRRLRVNAFHEGKPVTVYGRIRDISEDGLGAVLPCSLDKGEKVTLEFSVADGHESLVSAVVCHRQGFHYGFDFLNLDQETREVILGLCHEHESAPEALLKTAE